MKSSETINLDKFIKKLLKIQQAGYTQIKVDVNTKTNTLIIFPIIEV